MCAFPVARGCWEEVLGHYDLAWSLQQESPIKTTDPATETTSSPLPVPACAANLRPENFDV